jgi:hypothetical protein
MMQMTGTLALPGAAGMPFGDWSQAKRALDRAIADAHAKAAAASGTTAPPLVRWTSHDVRRTVATGLQRLGVRLERAPLGWAHMFRTAGSTLGVKSYQQPGQKSGGWIWSLPH